MRRNALLVFLALAFASIVASAQVSTAPVRVLSSNGVKAALMELRLRAERIIGRPISIEFSTASSIKQKIESGAPFDVVIVTKEAVEDLTHQGKIAPRLPRASLAKTGIGVGYRKGATKPDVRNMDAIKRTLLNAKSVAYTRDGASRPAIDRMIASLGIAKDLQPKTLLEEAGQAPLRVSEGKAELVLTLISEILPVEGIRLAGPIPKEFQSYVAFEAGLSATSQNSDSAKALIQFLSSSTAAAAFKATGMEPSK